MEIVRKGIRITKTKGAYPVSREEAKTHCEIETSDEHVDGYIDRLVKASTEYFENRIGKDLAVTTNIARLYNFTGGEVIIPEGNVRSVQYVISDTSTSLNVSDTRYYANYFKVMLTSNIGYSTEYTPLQVQYTSGFDEDECPEIFKQAILIKIKNFYDLDRDESRPIFRTRIAISDALLDPYRLVIT